MKRKRIMVDMCGTLIHHGHIRLLKKASKLGTVIVGLATDREIFQKKKYKPEIPFKHRKEILESIKYVDQVVPTPWLIDDNIFLKYNIDLLVHGSDNINLIPKNKLKIFPRTKNASSSDIRAKVYKSYMQLKRKIK